MPSDTFFSTPPEWHWLVILYFFCGGIAGGCYFIAALIDLFGHERDWPLARLGYYVAFIFLLLCPIFLTADLTRPERFWHMLIQDHRGLPMFKYWSPISIGSWGLVVFGGFAFLAVLGALAEDGRLPWAPLRTLRRAPWRHVIAAGGVLFAFFLAGYTGVLLDVTNRPLWGDTQLLGLLFIASAATSSASLLLLLGSRHRGVAPDALHRLISLENWASLLELLAIVAIVLSLGQVARVWLNAWGILLVVGVLLAGILLPLALHWRPRLLGAISAPTAAVLALAGGFLLRVIVVLSAQGV